MNRECGGCDSRVARRCNGRAALEFKYGHQDGVDDFGMMREGTLEGPTSLREHHVEGGDARHMEQQELGPQGDPPLPCQPLPPHSGVPVQIWGHLVRAAPVFPVHCAYVAVPPPRADSTTVRGRPTKTKPPGLPRFARIGGPPCTAQRALQLALDAQ